MFGRFTVEDAAEVLSEPIGTLLPMLSRLLATGLVVNRSGVLAPANRQLREAVLDATPEPVRLALHRRIGTMLLAQGRRSGAAVGHLIAGSRPGDDRALHALDRAVAELTAADPAAAADLAVHVLRLTKVHDPTRVRRLVHAIEALLAAGRVDEAEALARRAQLSTGQPARIRIRMGIALCTVDLLRGRPGAAVREAEAVLAEPDLPPPLRDSAEAYRLSGLLMLDDIAGAQRASADILGGGAHRRDVALGAAIMTMAWTTWRAGLAQTAVDLARAAVRRGTHGVVHDRLPVLGLAAMLGCVGDPPEASQLLHRVESVAGKTPGTIWATLPPLLRARHDLAAGRPQAALDGCRAGLDAAESADGTALARLGYATLCDAHLRSGDLQRARECLDKLAGLPTLPLAGCGTAQETWLRARVAEMREGPAAAVRLLTDQYTLSADPALLLEEPAAASWLTRLALRAGEPAQAEAVAVRAARLSANAPGLGSLAAASRHARALIDGDAAGLSEAAGQYLLPLPAANAAEDAGVVLADRGEQAAARLALNRALQGYRRIAAEPDIARVRARLHKLGAHAYRRTRQGQTQAGWPSLTDAERQVAQVVAEGRTNVEVAARLFVSRHTVDFHLRRIFRKLGVASRTELTRFVLERETSRPPSVD